MRADSIYINLNRFCRIESWASIRIYDYVSSSFDAATRISLYGIVFLLVAELLSYDLSVHMNMKIMLLRPHKIHHFYIFLHVQISPRTKMYKPIFFNNRTFHNGFSPWLTSNLILSLLLPPPPPPSAPLSFCLFLPRSLTASLSHFPILLSSLLFFFSQRFTSFAPIRFHKREKSDYRNRWHYPRSGEKKNIHIFRTTMCAYLRGDEERSSSPNARRKKASDERRKKNYIKINSH